LLTTGQRKRDSNSAGREKAPVNSHRASNCSWKESFRGLSRTAPSKGAVPATASSYGRRTGRLWPKTPVDRKPVTYCRSEATPYHQTALSSYEDLRNSPYLIWCRSCTNGPSKFWSIKFWLIRRYRWPRPPSFLLDRLP